jgi:alkyl sulfatase BDS1-like metallo-beta-lactamase superfamily hydrolase
MFRRLSARKPEVIRVTDRIYSAVDFGISNVLFAITEKSVVVIDTTESLGTARAALQEFRKICPLPVSHIIYTHSHGDHIRGAKVFHTPETTVIAQKRLPDELKQMYRLLPFRRAADALQFGFSLQVRDRGISHAGQGADGFLPPDITFDEQYRFEQGGVEFELYHTQGETLDHLMVWLPGEKVLFPGDLFYSSFPMLNNPMKPDRPVLAWAQSLERMRTFRPEYLVPSHSKPREGGEHIDSVLGNYAKAIRHVHDETVKGINQGLTLEEIRRRVRLPEELARLPYLHQGYGTVRWAVNGIYRQYTGWYTFNPVDLKPLRRQVRDRAILDASGGAEPLIKRARKALDEGHDQLALELADIVVSAQPRNRAALATRTEALKRLGKATKNGVERNIYLAAARNPLQWPNRLPRTMPSTQESDSKTESSVELAERTVRKGA